MNLENSGLLLNADALGNRHFERSFGPLHFQLVADL